MLDSCACCGAGGMLAQVMDPFADTCFAVCQTCLAPLHMAMGLRMRDVKPFTVSTSNALVQTPPEEQGL